MQPGAANWFDAPNWSGGLPGTGFEIVRIDQGTAQIDGGAALTSYGLTVGNVSSGVLQIFGGGSLDSGTNIFFLPSDVIVASVFGSSGDVLVTDAGSRWTIAANLYFGWGGDASLDLSNGGRLETEGDAFFGFEATATADVAISGVGSEFQSSGVLMLGRFGTADVTIDSGGQLTTSAATLLGTGAGGDGKVTVSGAGSRWDSTAEVTVGGAGSGELTIDGGGVADFATGGLVAGNATGSDATITVTGAGSELRSGAFILAADGAADLVVESAALVTSGEVALADGAASSATAAVTGIGTAWNTGDLSVGKRGTGALTVTAGASLDSANAKVGESTGSDGTLTVSGLGTTWDAVGDVAVGESGTATFNLNGGATSSTSGGLNMGVGASGDGTANISGGSSWTIGGASVIGDFGSGALALSGAGTADFDQSVVMGRGQSGVGNVTISGFGSAWTTGDLTVGSSGEGHVTVDGGGKLVTEQLLVGGLGTGSGDLAVSGFGSVLTLDSLIAGVNGDGVISVAAGANASVAGPVVLGQELVAYGELKVDGVGTALLTRDLIAGGAGGGALEVSGGALTNSIGNVDIGGGNGSVGTAEVRDAGSLWQVIGGLTVGDGGDGFLSVKDGGTVRAFSGAGVATGIGSSGTLSVAGVGSVFESTGNIDLAYSSGRVANLQIDGGLTYVSETVLIGDASSVFLTGGEISVNAIDRAAGGSFNWTGGKLTVRGPSGLSISAPGPLGANVAVDGSAGQYLEVTEFISIDPGAQLALTGSVLAAGGIVNDGQISFDGGSFTVGVGGFANNNFAAFSDATIGGSYSSPAGASTSITGTVVFDGAVSGGGAFTGDGRALLNGAHSPGDSPARVDISGDLEYGAGSSVTFELGGLDSGTGYDVLAVGGNVTLAGSMGVNVLGGFLLGPGMNFVVIETGGTLSGGFAGIGEGDAVGNFTGEDLYLTYFGGDGNDVELYTSPLAVPEPGSALLVGLGCFLLGISRRRRV